MADREARVRLSLIAGGYLSGLQQVSAATSAMQGRMAAGFTALNTAALAGLRNVGSTLGTMGTQIASKLRTAATVLGPALFGAAVKSGIDLQQQLKNIAFEIQAGTGKAVDYRQLQNELANDAAKWGRTTGELADAFRALYQETGNVEFTSKAMGEIAKAATASGASVEQLTSITGTLNEKFGITAQELPDVLAAMIAMSNKGGVGIEGMSEKLGILGASAKMAGLEGKDGLQQVVAMLNLADESTGSLRKSIAGVSGLLDTMGNVDFGKKVQQELGIRVTDKSGKTAADALQKIIAKTGGRSELLAKVFTGDQLKIVSDVGKVYAKAVEQTGGTVKEKAAAGALAVEQAFKNAAKQTLSAAQVEDQAQKRLQDPQRKLAQAWERLTQSLATEEVVKGLGDLAKYAPRAADGIARLASFITKNAGLVVGGAVGGKLGLSFVGGAMANAGTQVGTAASGAMAKGATGIGKTMGAQLAGGFKTGGAVGISIASAILTAGIVNFEKSEADAAAAGQDLNKVRRSEELAEVNELIAGQRKRVQEVSKPGLVETFTGEALKHSPQSMVDKLFGVDPNRRARAGGQGFAEMVTARDPSAIRTQQGMLAEMEAKAAKLEGTSKVASALERTAKAAEAAAVAMGKIRPPAGAGGEGSNGLPPKGGNTPGFLGG